MVHRVKAVSRNPVVSLFDIRVGTNEKDVIVITPSEIESAPTLVRGTVVLSLKDSLAVRNITLRMYGVASVAWVDPTANRTPPTRSSQKQTKIVFDKEWSFLPQTHSMFTLKEGNYEYPFDVLLPDDIPDSVEGLPGGAIIYKMKATIERTGLVNKNVTCRKHIRILRTISPTSFEFLQSQSIENLWPNKCEYAIEIPTTAHLIGSQIPYHIRMIPHVKGLSICRLGVELKEHYAFAVLDSKNALIAEKKNERIIKSVSSDAPTSSGEGEWNIEGHIEVPNSLDRCTQDCDANHIKVKHRVKFVIGLRNADGHVSEIRASLPVALVLPPCVSSTGHTPQLDDSTVNHLSYLETNGDALPSYESRVYDRLWDGISYAGLDTSTLNTPALSRRTSLENIRDMDDTHFPDPDALEAGLHQALNEQVPESPDRGPAQTPPLIIDEDQPRLTPTSSLETQDVLLSPSENGSNTAIPSSHEEYLDVRRLSRVPSYDAANWANTINLDPIASALPTYAETLSTIPESESQSESTSSGRRSDELPQLSTRGVSPSRMRSGRSMSVYGSAFDDPMRRISLMRNLFSSR